MKKLLIIILKTYKSIMSPLLEAVFGKGCIFTPTCSEYVIDSIRKHGIKRGLSFSIRRLSRCHPGTMPAYDPVPEGI
ncbi:MAG: membrane protein insertion efficiency factor YidD [Thermodesulfovibrionia bacterium]|nr:membrane protein insertion efficiency factor YidD [Thermodesulfovibrionia bacterium]